MADIRSCTHIKDDGSPCGAIPIQNQSYCYFHRKYYNPPALPGDKNFQAPLLESHESIQLALTHLYQAFLSKKIDMKEAQFGLQVLRLASKTITAVEKSSKQAKEKVEARRAEATAEEQMVLAPEPIRKAELQRRIALNDRLAAESKAAQAAAQGERGVWDPYGCMPKNNASR